MSGFLSLSSSKRPESRPSHMLWFIEVNCMPHPPWSTGALMRSASLLSIGDPESGATRGSAAPTFLEP